MAGSNILSWEKFLKKPLSSYKKWFNAEKKFILKYITKNSRVLEVGCGDGRSLKDVLKITPYIVGVDNDPIAVEHATKNFRRYPQVKILLAEGSHLPFKANLFNCVTCIGTFTNLGKQKFKVLSEMKRVTKLKGKLIISAFSETSLPERLKVYKKISLENIAVIKKSGTVIFKDFGKNNISEQFSEKQLRAIFKKAKLKVLEIKKVGIGYVCVLEK